jgi:hypothetical protein
VPALHATRAITAAGERAVYPESEVDMKCTHLRWLIAIALLTTACATPVTYHNTHTYIQPLATPVTGAAVTVTVAADQEWQDTGIELAIGQRVSMTARGEWCYGGGPTACRGAEGVTGGNDPLRLLPGEPVGMLLARIGGGYPFVVGQGIAFIVHRDGRLRLAGNDSTAFSARSDNSGSLAVAVVRSEPSEADRKAAAARRKIHVKDDCVDYLRDDGGERFVNHCPYPVRIRYCVDLPGQDHPADCLSGKSRLLEPLPSGDETPVRGIEGRTGEFYFKWCQAPGCSDPGDPSP